MNQNRMPRRRRPRYRTRRALAGGAATPAAAMLLLAAAAAAALLSPAMAARALQQSPGSFTDIANLGDAYNSYYGDPWGTAGGYYDP
jgi:hypothetical protein